MSGLVGLGVVLPAQAERMEVGTASWYGRRHAGRLMANGERFDPNRLTCASLHWPLGTRLHVCNATTGRCVTVRVTDRGPYNRRVIDLSHAAAVRLGFAERGLAPVTIREERR